MRDSHHAGMHDQTVLAPQAHPAPAAAILGMEAFQRVIDSGLLHCTVPAALGGHGGSLADLAEGARALAATSPASAWVLWAQRLAIEALIQSGNGGLRDYLLPDLLNGERAGTLPPSLGSAPLHAVDTGRGWTLHGRLQGVPNLQWVGHSLAAPVKFGASAEAVAWVWLRGEEDGIDIVALPDGEAPVGSQTAHLALRGVYFREDEWLSGPELTERIAPVDLALRAALRRDPSPR
jgi:alkylation response protein AidB-like acyl-CoA dehydrogenase